MLINRRVYQLLAGITCNKLKPVHWDDSSYFVYKVHDIQANIVIIAFKHTSIMFLRKQFKFACKIFTHMLTYERAHMTWILNNACKGNLQ